MTFKGKLRLSNFRVKKVLHRIDSRTNNGNHLRSHLRAIMALDHSCLGLENESLENNIRPNFFAFDKFN